MNLPFTAASWCISCLQADAQRITYSRMRLVVQHDLPGFGMSESEMLQGLWYTKLSNAK